MLCSWGLSIGLMLFMARDNAELRKERKNLLIRKIAIFQPQTVEYVNYVDIVFVGLKTCSI